MKQISNELIELLRAPDNKARVMVEGVAQERNADGSDAADIRQRYDQWLQSDGWPVTGLEALQSGVRLLASTAAGPQNTTVNGYARTIGDSGATAPFMDPLSPNNLNGQPAHDANFRTLVAGVWWLGSESPDVELTQVQAYLNPQYDLTISMGKAVSRWRLDLYQVDQILTLTLGIRPYLTAYADATSQAAGLVTFDLSANPPKPKRHGLIFGRWEGVTLDGLGPMTIAMVSGYDAEGNPAHNIGWGYDGTQTEATSAAGSVLYGWGISWLFLLEAMGPASKLKSPGSVYWHGIDHLPAIKFVLAAYTGSKTITFDSGSPLDLGGSYASDSIRLTLESQRPLGTSLAGQVKDDVGVWQDFEDGQFVSELLGDWSSSYQTLSMRATLTPNTGLDASPILRSLGAQAVGITDLSDVAEVESVQWVFDPVDHHAEVPELRLKAIHDGERDYRDVISRWLSERPIGSLYLHLAIGHPALTFGSSHQWDGSWVFDGSVMLGPSETFARTDWVHSDDFLIDDYDLASEAATITAVSPLSLIRGALPILADQQIGHPIEDTSVGSWTEVGGATFLYPAIADVNGGVGLNPWDDATAIQCPTNPSSAAATFLIEPLSPPTVAAIGQVLVQFRYKLTSGTSLTLACALMEGATQRANASVTVTSSDYAIGTLTPTVTELADIVDWTNLRVKLTANGTGRLRVSWVRVVILPFRAPLRYSNAKPSDIAQDIIQNQIGLQQRYCGADLTGLAGADTGTTIALSKTIDEPAGGSTDLAIAKHELDALAWVAGVFFSTSNGRIVARKLYRLTANGDGTVAYQLATDQPPVVFFESNELEPLSVKPGFAFRVPQFDVNWGFSEQANRYTGISRGVSDVALENLGQARVVADQQASETIARWIPTGNLANALSLRQVNVFGMGYLSWRFRSTYCYPELELGDVVAVQTDRFLAYDPTATRALSGMQWVSGIITGIFSIWGNEFQVWVPTYANIGGASAQPPSPLDTTQVTIENLMLSVDTGGTVSAVLGTKRAASVRVAISTSAYPSQSTTEAATATNVDANGNATISLGTVPLAGTAYVSALAFALPDGTGSASILRQAQISRSATGSKRVIFLTSGTSWTVPGDFNSVSNTIEAIGGGGGGAVGVGDTNGGGGGGGGEYRKIVNFIPSGSTVAYTIGGGGGSGTAGTDTTWESTTLVAKGGGAGSGSSGGSGGSGGTGSTGHNGGTGGSGSVGTGDRGGGGGGGSAGWITAGSFGSPASGATAGGGGAGGTPGGGTGGSAGGGSGGNGAAWGWVSTETGAMAGAGGGGGGGSGGVNDGGPAGNYGGGGGGAGSNAGAGGNGGSGRPGIIVVTYTSA